MRIVCAWCNKVLGEKKPLEDKSITHGICPKCARAFTKKPNPELKDSPK